jgi:hypothetical protein
MAHSRLDINPIRRSSHRWRAGGSADAKFRERRRAEIRIHWRDWGTLIGAIVVSLVLVIVTHGLTQLVFAGVTGALISVVVVGWMIGGHVRSLPWAWGAVGERDTAATLDALDNAWVVVHDLERGRGNWDHVLVGPPGVLLLDTKVLTAPARVSDDALRAGRQVMPGGAFRGAAAGLADALAETGDGRPWVQPVVVIWGDFEQRIHEEQGVVYASGAELLDWLGTLPPKTQEARRQELARRVEAIASSQREDDRLPAEKS